MKRVRDIIRRLGLDSDEGQGLVEYGMILALVSLLFFAAYANFGGQTNRLLDAVAASVSSVS